MVKYICISLSPPFPLHLYLHCCRIQGEQKPDSLDSLRAMSFFKPLTNSHHFNKSDNGKLLLIKSSKPFSSVLIFLTFLHVFIVNTHSYSFLFPTDQWLCCVVPLSLFHWGKAYSALFSHTKPAVPLFLMEKQMI